MAKKRTKRRGRKATYRRRLSSAERERREAARLRSLAAVALMRRGRSLSRAAPAAKTTPRTVQKLMAPRLRRRAGRYRAVPFDELRRPMRILMEGGNVVLDIRSSKTATRIAQHWIAVDAYLRGNGTRALNAFAGKSFIAGGQRHPFITDTRLLDRLAAAGQVSFEDLYETIA